MKVATPGSMRSGVTGGSAELARIYREHREALLQYLHYLCRGRSHQAEDLMQEAFLRFWEYRKENLTAGLGSSDAVRGLLLKYGRNLWSNWRKHEQVRERHSEVLARGQKETGPASEGPTLEQRELERAVEHAVIALPDDLREVFLLQRYQGWTYARIAELLEIAPATVAWRMQQALAFLKDRLRAFLMEA